jgi:mannose-1-phosphate guanylyltransferase
MKAVIFAGGVGTRLWPLSRKRSPKQFEKIVGDKSTLQLATERIQPDFTWSDIYVATGKQHVQLVQGQLHKLPPDHVIGEPEMRDVGPAVGLMTGILTKVAPQEPMVILWSDHLVKNERLFKSILLSAGEVISKNPNKIIFVSQKPRFASDNLGWIEYGKQTAKINNIPFYSFVDFQYKPDKTTAKRYFESGHHAWNVILYNPTQNNIRNLHLIYIKVSQELLMNSIQQNSMRNWMKYIQRSKKYILIMRY